MQTPEIIKQTWLHLVDKLTMRFGAEGYQVVQFKDDDILFGSRYLMWSNNVDALRLTWDGKECWFILEEALLPVTLKTPWQEIIVCPFDPNEHDEIYARSLIEDVLDSLD